MTKKVVGIDNFIGVYDNFITKQECDKAIKFFETQNKFRKTLDRVQSENQSILKKQDKQYFANGTNIEFWWDNLKTLIVNFEMAWKHYLRNTGAISAYGEDMPFHFSSMKIQKTLPSQGYHVWHIEHSRGFEMESRAFVWSVYLNDVKEGGETEFLHFSKRVKPKKGRIVIWPAGFPYLHRGNPPISNEKYLLTSWMTLKPI
jgi:hypothetical protein